ncbi:hypothetical protein phi1422_0019 [Bdellovibrio phage phi1422]|uniref:hypothetical protein n=1 Tax=Bdellovibrio phage phi1422 TaxID=1127515 RepID=UPI0002536D12|nr:hypothetical protein F395_gp19 [Bdellovibrio phage phi1422]AFC22539.1 hypothetical protein phi1422_0019 [Bdellovibrio phage phi1422]
MEEITEKELIDLFDAHIKSGLRATEFKKTIPAGKLNFKKLLEMFPTFSEMYKKECKNPTLKMNKKALIAKKVLETISEDEVFTRFNDHMICGASVQSFRVKLKMGQVNFRRLLKKYPNFEKVYKATAKENCRMRVF